jgi:hypothetical protein
MIDNHEHMQFVHNSKTTQNESADSLIFKHPCNIFNPSPDVLLERWLKKLSKRSVSAFADPGYSNYYLSYFGNYYKNGEIYNVSSNSDDLDTNLNIGYFLYQPGTEKEAEDLVIEKFIDTVVQPDESVLDIVIPPGTNQSNSNFLFKLFDEALSELETTNIPVVSNKSSFRYTGASKRLKAKLSKRCLYRFLMSRSD